LEIGWDGEDRFWVIGWFVATGSVLGELGGGRVFLGGEAEVFHEGIGTFGSGLGGEAGIGEEFVAGGFERHFREGGVEVDFLNFVEEFGVGGFFLFGLSYGDVARVGPAA
jgi:hypothetical protein